MLGFKDNVYIREIKGLGVFRFIFHENKNYTEDNCFISKYGIEVIFSADKYDTRYDFIYEDVTNNYEDYIDKLENDFSEFIEMAKDKVIKHLGNKKLKNYSDILINYYKYDKEKVQAMIDESNSCD